MFSVPATVRNGQFVPLEPIPWPEGAVVEVRLADVHAPQPEWGMTEEEQVGSPEAIARWQAMVAALPKSDWSDADQEEWDRNRREYKEWELANREKRERRLEFPE